MQSSCAGSGRSLAAPQGYSQRSVSNNRQTKYWHYAAAADVAREARGSHNKSAAEPRTVIFCGALKGKFHVVHRKERGETKSTAAETEGGGRGENRLNRRSLRGRKKIQMRHKERKSGIVCRTENKSCCVAAQSKASGKEKLSSLCDFN